MKNFSYKTKNLMGLIGVLSTNICFLMSIRHMSFLLVTLLTTTLGIYCGKTAFEYLSLRLWTSLAGLLSFYGSILALTVQDSLLACIGCAFMGFASGTLFFVLPANLIITWFSYEKPRAFSSIWGMSILLGFLLDLWINFTSPSNIIFCLIFNQLSIVPLKKFPAVYKDCFQQNLSADNKKLLPLSLFALLLSISGGFMVIAGKALFTIPLNLFFSFMGAILLPLFIGFFSEKRGIYSSCVLVIFAAELCAMCLSYYSKNAFVEYMSMFLLGGIFILPFCLLPLVCYYIFGLGGYNGRLAKSMSFVPIGYLIAFLLPVKSDNILPLVFFIILCSFFAVFSAWKHRLTLLKSS